MSANTRPGQDSSFALVGGGLLVVLCCAVGPAVIGAVAGSAVGGWLGIACAVEEPHAERRPLGVDVEA